MTFGEKVKELRLAKGIGLREFCQRLELDPAEWSKVERGLIEPPKKESWMYFRILELAYDDKGDITEERVLEIDGLIDSWVRVEPDVLSMLPAFPHGTDGNKPTGEQLDDLIEKVKKSTERKQ